VTPLSWAKEDGRAIDTPRRDEAVAVENERDILIISLRATRRSWRRIGATVGLSHVGARKRYHAIPEAVREHYSRVALG
jgi:hypothetical protein